METAACIAKKAKSIVVIGMEAVPFERVLGEQIGIHLQKVFFYIDKEALIFQISCMKRMELVLE